MHKTVCGHSSNSLFGRIQRSLPRRGNRHFHSSETTGGRRPGYPQRFGSPLDRVGWVPPSDKFEDQYETALIDLINGKAGRANPSPTKERPRGENVVDLMDALRKSLGAAEASQRF